MPSVRPTRSPRRVLAAIAGAAAALILVACGGGPDAAEGEPATRRRRGGGAARRRRRPPACAWPGCTAASATRCYVTGAPGAARAPVRGPAERPDPHPPERAPGRTPLPRHLAPASRPAASRACSAWPSTRTTRATAASTSNYTNRSGDTRVVEYRRATADPREPARAPGVLLGVDQPFANHNGGALAFGPDGILYIALGDGGSGDDPQNNAPEHQLAARQAAADRRRRAAPAAGPTASRPDNPFAGGGGRGGDLRATASATRGASRSTATRGDLWIGDVGQNAIEEIDYRPRGAGAGATSAGGRSRGARATSAGAAALDGPARHTPPVAQYSALAGLLGHRRLRLPRHEGPGARRPVRLRRLLLRYRLEHAGRTEPRRRAPGDRPRGPALQRHVVRREPQRRRLRASRAARCTASPAGRARCRRSDRRPGGASST